jgi:hypothetical protein
VDDSHSHQSDDKDPHWFERGLAERAGFELTTADFEQCEAVGEFWNGGFADLESAVQENALSRPAAAFLAITLWPNKPDSVSVDYALWARMFRDGRFTEDGRRVTPPARPALLFRGATPEGARGLSWTTDLEQARYFATSDRQRNPAEARVWMSWVPPDLMLARFGRGWESEVIVDAEHLTAVVELSGARVGKLMSSHGGRFAGTRRKHLRWAVHSRSLRRECRARRGDLLAES